MTDPRNVNFVGARTTWLGYGLRCNVAFMLSVLVRTFLEKKSASS